MGKTHRLKGFGLEVGNSKKVMFISAERFMYHFVKSIKSNEMVKFKDFFRGSNFFIRISYLIRRFMVVFKKKFDSLNTLFKYFYYF